MLTVLVCGSRDWTDEAAIAAQLARVADYDCLVIHGDAPGADRIAASIAPWFGFTVRAFPADWKRHGKAAGPIRNLAMLDERPDLVIAFQRDGSRGTAHTIAQAKRRGIPVEVHTS